SDGTKLAPNAPYGATNYVGNQGGPGQVQAITGTIVPNGAFIRGWGDAQNFGPIGLENIKDGTAYTGLFSERLMGVNGGGDTNPGNKRRIGRDSKDWKRGIWMGPKGAGWRTGTAGASAFLAGCQAIPGSAMSIRYNGNGIYWTMAFPWHVVVNEYQHVGAPN